MNDSHPLTNDKIESMNEWYYPYVLRAVASWNDSHEQQIDLSHYDFSIIENSIAEDEEQTYSVEGLYRHPTEQRPDDVLGNWGSQFGYPDFTVHIDRQTDTAELGLVQ